MRKRRLTGAILVPLALLLSVSLAAAPTASAAHHGKRPKLLKPKKNHKVKVGKRVTFRVRDHGHVYHHKVWLALSNTKKRGKDGTLKNATNGKGVFDQMKRKKHHIYKLKPKLFTFAGYWNVTPGKYYWQAFHIDSNGGGLVHSKIRALRVVR